MCEPGRLTSGPGFPVLAPIRPLALNSEVRLPSFRKSGRALSPYACVPSSAFPPTALPEDPRVLALRLSSLETIDLQRGREREKGGKEEGEKKHAHSCDLGVWKCYTLNR